MGIRGGLITNAKPRSAELRAVVTRADGSIEDLGVVAYYHHNPLRRWAWNLRQLLKRKR